MGWQGISWSCGDIIPKTGISDGCCPQKTESVCHPCEPGRRVLCGVTQAGPAMQRTGRCPWLLLPLQCPEQCFPRLLLLPAFPLPSDVLPQRAGTRARGVCALAAPWDAAWGRDGGRAPGPPLLLARPGGVSPPSRAEPRSLLLSGKLGRPLLICLLSRQGGMCGGEALAPGSGGAAAGSD